jgi:hypothetical protein
VVVWEGVGKVGGERRRKWSQEKKKKKKKRRRRNNREGQSRAKHEESGPGGADEIGAVRRALGRRLGCAASGA